MNWNNENYSITVKILELTIFSLFHAVYCLMLTRQIFHAPIDKEKIYLELATERYAQMFVLHR